MIKPFFAVFDSAAKVFNPPFLMHNRAEAIRGFGAVVNEPGTQFNQFARDFTLYEIGSFDSDTGHLTEQVPVIVISASELRETEYPALFADASKVAGTKKK